MDSRTFKKNPRNRQGKSRARHNLEDQRTGSISTVGHNNTKTTDVSINIESIPADKATAAPTLDQSQARDTQQVAEVQIKDSIQSSPSQPQQFSTGNEEQKRDIFIDVEPPSDASIVVKPEETNNEPTRTILTDVDERQPEPSIADESDDTSLPDTLTRLNTANGAEVYLLGTAHFSPNSVKDVQKVMRAIKPNIVVLELCKERAFMLSLNEADLLEQNKNLTFDKVRSAIAQKGLAQGLIYIMFIKMSASLTEKLGLAPGSEFRAGANEAHKIPGCSIALGDRSLKVTLARAVASVSTWQKMKLIYQVLMNDAGMTQEEVEKCKEKDILEQLLQELGVEFPGFKRVILDERNIYLAHSIYHYAQNFENSLGSQKVVAIVGIGHVAGIVEHWGKTKNEDIAALNEIPKVSKTRRFVSKTIKYCSIALLVYVGYRIIVPTSIQNSISDKLSSLK